jgi:hypothetical protein
MSDKIPCPYLLVNTDTGEYIAKVRTVKCGVILAEIRCPVSNFIIIQANSRRDLARFTIPERQLTCKFHNVEFTGKETFSQLTDILMNIQEEMVPNDIRDENELIKANGGIIPKVTMKPPKQSENEGPRRAGKTKSRPANIKQTITRPSPGTSTGKVWDMCDKLMDENNNVMPTKAAVAEALTGQVNPSTVGVQFGKWKKMVGSKKAVQ